MEIQGAGGKGWGAVENVVVRARDFQAHVAYLWTWCEVCTALNVVLDPFRDVDFFSFSA